MSALQEALVDRWLSWSKAHDWKSCRPHKGLEGSNPSLSARTKPRYSLEKLCIAVFLICKAVQNSVVKVS